MTRWRALHDPRRQASCLHKLATTVRQRPHALAPGYEDLNDHQTLRHDAGLRTAAASTSPLASPATLCRLEQAANRDDAIGLHNVLFAQFLKAHRRRPKRLMLDFDATDVPLHGEQEGRFFHGYYDHYCTVICRCRCSAAATCWWRICAAVTGRRRGTDGRSWRCW